MVSRNQADNIDMKLNNTDPRIARLCETCALIFAFAVVALGITVLLGWALDIAALKSVLPVWVTMKANTALGFLLAGVSLAAAGRRNVTPGLRHVHVVLAALVTLLGTLTLVEYAWGVDFGIDQWLFSAPAESGSNTLPGRMAVATAAGFTFTGLALLLLDSRWGRRGFQIAALLGTLIGLLALLGYGYGVTALYGIGAYSSVALHTAAGLVVVNLGVLLARPRRGLMAVVTSATVGGVMARQLLPMALIAPFLIGWLHIQGELRGLYQTQFGVALVALTYVVLFAVFIWRTAEQLRLSDQRRTAAECLRHHQQAELTGIINSAMDAVIMVDGAQRIALFNPAAEHMFGRTAGAVLGAPLDVLLPSRFQAGHGEHIRRFGATGTTSRRMGGLGTITGLRANGEEFPIEASISQLEVNGDQYFTVILRDITERQRLETDLRIAATVLEAQVGIMVTDPNGVILRVNRMFTEDSGYSAAEIVGQTPRLLKSGRHDTAFYDALWASLRETGVWQGEIFERRKSGEIYPKWMVITALRGDDGVVTHYVSTQTDITQRKAAEDEIKQLAFYDPLTRLPNRRLLRDRLHQALLTHTRSLRQGALLFIDLDNFKALNDTLGHDHGDLLLKQVAERLAACIREGDTVARLGGDEFVVMLEALSPQTSEAANQAETVGKSILAALNCNYQLWGHDFHCSPSIGVTLFSDQHGSMDELLKQADLAMYQAKAAGRNTLRFFDQQMQVVVNAHVLLEMELRNGLREGQFVLYYQAQVADRDRLIGAEALLRWQHPERGLVSPYDFILLAEETRLILPLGRWVLETACAQLAAWAETPDTAQLTLAVNVSAKQLHQADFINEVLSIVERTGANPHKLKLELTESLLMDNVEDTIAKMSALKERGVRFALDDFGTGYSCLSYLKRLPLEKLKIDRSFVRDVLTDANDAAITKTIVALARSLDLGVIAEGVETEAQRDFLSKTGCHAYQGYLFSRPLPLPEFEVLARRR